ncbi:MAG: 30S ribosomal protein S12 methylthiotransferase RimO [Myxococcales bacterium]|nr:30S ribosomal protein S12 methylthiotransferase RimO [Myxococcales bacterium]
MSPSTFHIVSLGCPKNRVDAEILWAGAAGGGRVAVDDPAEADLIILATCAFVGDAVQESLEAIRRFSELRRSGRCRRLIVCGCLPARLGAKELARLAPEIDAIAGPAEVGRLARALARPDSPVFSCAAPRRSFLPSHRTPRANSLSPGAAYLKVAEGCSRRCSFCIIPSLRGPQRSRPLSDLCREAETLTRLGIKEIVLVAQDLSSWGSDLRGRPRLAHLVEALAGTPGLYWLRLMYLYPSGLERGLLRVLARGEPVLPYLDLPLQHADGGVLRAMRRGGDFAALVRLVERLRAEVPGLVLRTTLMTGFPGEDARAFRTLERFVRRCRFERLGVFCFSPEPGTPAARLPGRPAASVARARRERLMRLQHDLALEYHRGLLGKTVEVLIEGTDGERLLGRSASQAPEVDGATFVRGRGEPGDMVRAVVRRVDAYDLEAETPDGSHAALNAPPTATVCSA